MHKLLLRQLNKFRGSEEIPDDWKGFIEAVDQAYMKSDEEYTMVERSLDFTSNELLHRNDELSKAFKELGEAQVQLVQSSKMVALGQLISGIAHEVNTPAGSIAGAIEEIQNDFASLLGQLVDIAATLNAEEMKQYLDVCEQLRSLEKNSSTRDQRQMAREIETLLTSHGVNNARHISKSLASIGFTNKSIDGCLPLLRSPHADKIVQSLFNLGMSQIHVNDIRIAIGRITHIVKALKLYTHADQQSYVKTIIKDDLDNTLVILHNKIKRAVIIKKEYDDIPEVTCYADQLNQVWTNLINNSIEAMKGDGIIILRVKKHDDKHIVVEVEDNGPGIPSDVMPRIFEPYFTTKPKGVGTGLGLSISADIVRKQHGTLSVDSKPGQTIFRIVLPINVPEIEKEAEQQP